MRGVQLDDLEAGLGGVDRPRRRKPSTIASSSPSVSARGRVGSRGERTADGRDRVVPGVRAQWSRGRGARAAQAATAPSARIASARAAMPGTASGRHASVVIRRRHVDSGAVTVPPTVSIAAPPAARRRQYSASPGSASPSSTRPRPWAVPTIRLRSAQPGEVERARGVLERRAHRRVSACGPAAPDGLEVAAASAVVLAPQDLEHEPADLPAAGLAPQLVVVAADEQLRARPARPRTPGATCGRRARSAWSPSTSTW